MTDHGNMFGASEFYNAATKVGIKPIIGVEAYVARFPFRHPAHPGGDRARRATTSPAAVPTPTLTMVAENATGLRNLFRLVAGVLRGSAGQVVADGRRDHRRTRRGHHRHHRLPSGEVQTRLRLGHDREALESAARWREIFGPDNFFPELMDHGLSIERRVRDGLLEVGRKLGIRPLATNDCHYVTRDAAHNHEAPLCVQTGKTLSDPNRFKFDGDGYYLKSAAEMRAAGTPRFPRRATPRC